MKRIQSLIFIYNADSGKWGAFIDSAKKVLMIQGCPLCTITHSVFGEKAQWKACKEEMGVPIRVYHRDEVPEAYKTMAENNYPCILAQTDKGVDLLAGPDVMRRCRGDAWDLKSRLYHHASLIDLEFPTPIVYKP
ncbi:MAG: hypothetical protein HY548_09775 [Elusimicrobia bacterium]|nr:hypothetical protein [Elusimicrobiota bacterium]